MQINDLNKEHQTLRILNPTLCKNKTLHKANKANKNMFKSVMNEQNSCEISDRVTKLNIENIHESALSDKFIEFEDTILAEVIVDHLIRDLNELKDQVANLKSGHGLLVNNVYPQIYQQKKELISKFILNSQDEPINQKLVY